MFLRRVLSGIVGIATANQATQFQHPEPPPGVTGQVGGWQVNPYK